jgi:hypothetical protein
VSFHRANCQRIWRSNRTNFPLDKNSLFNSYHPVKGFGSLPIFPRAEFSNHLLWRRDPMESKYKQLITGAALAAILLQIVVFPKAGGTGKNYEFDRSLYHHSPLWKLN